MSAQLKLSLRIIYRETQGGNKTIMKVLKLTFTLLLSIITLSFSGCGDDEEIRVEFETNKTEAEEEAENFPTSNVYLGCLKGAAEIGFLNLMELEENENAYNSYHFTVTDSINELAEKFSNNEIQIAAIPANTASVLYNKTNGNVQIAAINSIGNIYITETGNTIKSIKDLSNKTIYISDKEGVCEYILNEIFKENSVENVTIEYKSPTELISFMTSKEAAISVLYEPYISTISAENPNLRTVINVSKEWENISDTEVISSCIAVQKEYAQKHPRVFGHFLQEYYDSITKAAENVPETAKLAEKFKAVSKASIAEKAIPNCSLVYTDGGELDTAVTNFLTELYNSNPDSIGGVIPGEDFFYTPKEKYAVKKK